MAMAKAAIDAAPVAKPTIASAGARCDSPPRRALTPVTNAGAIPKPITPATAMNAPRSRRGRGMAVPTARQFMGVQPRRGRFQGRRAGLRRR